MAKTPKQYGVGLALTPKPPAVPDAPVAPQAGAADAVPFPSPPPIPGPVVHPPGGDASAVRPARRRPMESKADPTIIYLHPEGKMSLKRFALGRGMKVRVHDLLMEAVEEWAAKRGVQGPFRVPSLKPRRQD